MTASNTIPLVMWDFNNAHENSLVIRLCLPMQMLYTHVVPIGTKTSHTMMAVIIRIMNGKHLNNESLKMELISTLNGMMSGVFSAYCGSK